MAKCSDPLDLEEISIPALGRPFKLGRFYDICNDLIFTEQVRPPVAFDYEDPKKSLQIQCLPHEILKNIDIDPKTKLGVAIDVAKYPGCFSAFLKDFNSSKVKTGKCFLQQCRFRSTQVEESYLKSRLSQHSGQTSIVATHIVQKITFGCNSIIWMEDETPEEEKKYLRSFLCENIENITELQNSEKMSISFEKKELASFRCKMYSDVDPISPCNNLYQALQHFKYVQISLNENAVPVEVTLYPLPLQGKPSLNWELGNTLASKALCILGDVDAIEERCMKFLHDPEKETDYLILEDVTTFQNFIAKNKKKILSKLRRVTLKNPSDLETLIEAIEKSPFNPKVCTQWLKDKESDKKRIKEIKKQYSDLALSAKTLHNPSAKSDFELVIQLPKKDALLQKMSKYIHGYADLVLSQQPCAPENTIAFEESCKLFQEILHRLKGRQEMTSLVLEKSDVPTLTGSVRYYMNNKLVDGEFKLPTQPKILRVEISARSIKLSWMTSDTKPNNESYEITIKDEKDFEHKFTSDVCNFEIEELDLNTQFRVTIASQIGPFKSEPSQEMRIIPLTHEISVPRRGFKSQQQEQNTDVSGQIEIPNSQLLPKEPEITAPGKPKCMAIATKILRLQWTPPKEKAQHVSKYLIFEAGKNLIAEVKGDKTKADIDILPNVVYSFTIQADFANGVQSDHSEKSDTFEKKMSRDELRVESIKERSTCITKPGEKPQVYLLNLKRVSQNRDVQKFEFGTQKLNYLEKVVMLLGATGSGKTTLINGMVNFFFGLKWDDDFRLKLVSEGEEVDQTESQTKAITSYTIHADEGSTFPFSLTLVDTPGFGDTRGLKHDQEIMSQIKDFFSATDHHRLDHIDGIGLVVQSTLGRLTPTQKYIFDSILLLFGKDIAENIFPLLTFADGHMPQVLQALKNGKIPYNLHFKFNNSVLYADVSENSKFKKLFWDMGETSYMDFFNSLSKVSPKSLSLTKEVLDERQKLEAQIEGIREDIAIGLHKMEELEYEWTAIQYHQEEIAQNEEFSFPVIEITLYRTPLIPNQLAMNCSKCLWTCHSPCHSLKRFCLAFDQRKCLICPSACTLDCHERSAYRFTRIRKEITRTSDELCEKYLVALDKKDKHEKMLKIIASDIKKTHVKLTEKILKVKHCVERLREIALKPSLSSTVIYVEQIIHAEKMEQNTGWTKRVEKLEEIKETAGFLDQLTNDGFNPFKNFSQTIEKVKNHLQKDGRNLLPKI